MPNTKYDIDLHRLINGTSMFAAYERLTGLPARGIRTTRGVLVPCPSPDHNDDTPSCSVRDEPNAKVWHSFCCGQSGGLLDFIVFAEGARTRGAAVDWLVEERLSGVPYEPTIDFASKARHRKHVEPLLRKQVVDRYDYVDLDGTLLYRVVREEGVFSSGKPGKTFSQYRPSPGCNDPRLYGTEGPGWEKGIAGVKAVPYRLPEVFDAARAGKPILYVEGEKKVKALESLGLVATTNSSGSSWNLPPEWAGYFQGTRSLIFLPDCDLPGRRSVALRAELFRKAGIPVRAYDLAPERWDHYDVANLVPEQRAAGLDDAGILQELRQRCAAHDVTSLIQKTNLRLTRKDLEQQIRELYAARFQLAPPPAVGVPAV
ncbi:hypothetical protein EPN42_10990 [bacterium]|nr:MAG: hypothetical protein EPN42_10990 [bacterium]